MGKSVLKTLLLEGLRHHSNFVRVVFYIWFGAGLLATNNCVADDYRGLPTEFARYSEILKDHFCSCEEDESIPSSDLCYHLCESSLNELGCLNNEVHREHREARCMSGRQTLQFVCGYQDAIVCADEFEICLNETCSEYGDDKSFCICRKGSESTVQDGSCVAEDTPFNAEPLVIASSLSVLLVILLIILICCVCRRLKTRAERRSKTSTSKLDTAEDLEYSYAYGHRDRPLSELQAEDLDADQIDHYYCHLKQEGRLNEQQGKGEENTRHDRKVITQDKDDQAADIDHTYFVLEKMSTDEPAKICCEEDEKRSPSVDKNDIIEHSYAKVTPIAQLHIDSSGYEVAREQRQGDVKTTAANQEEANMQSTVGAPSQGRDSGYEVATVASGGNDEQESNVPRHSYVTLEPRNGEQPPNTDSGYEVANIIEPTLHDDYDHLERREPLKPREGAIP